MTRTMVFAILAFSSLILVNLAVFSYLSFGTLSKRMIHEKLTAGLADAQRELAAADFSEPGMRDVTRRLAPVLERYEIFLAIWVVHKGKVVHREIVEGTVVVESRTQNERERFKTEPFAQNVAMPPSSSIPVQTGVQDENGTQIVLEYDQQAINEQVDGLRKELNRKLGVAILISLGLLIAGLIYVIWAYKRSQAMQAKARKADRMAYVGTLSSGLAHEIRNPLNSMNMNVQLIQEELDESGIDQTGDLQDMLEGTRNEIGRLERLVSSFLAYARPAQPILKEVQVNDLVQEILTFLEPEVRENGIQLLYHPSEDLPEIPLDESMMKQALMNVIQNAIQVLRADCKLEVSTRKAGGDKVLVIVADEGPGISEEELKHIFKEFYSTRRGGTGLGLPIAQRIAELHQGGLKVESEVGKGTSITFILPMAKGKEP